MLLRRTCLFAPAIAFLRAQGNQVNLFGDAEAYERFMGRWSRLVAAPLVDFSGPFPQNARILDVGSGTGSLAFTIAQRNRGARIIGIDPSKEYVAYTAIKNSFRNRASFEVGDAQQLHFPNSHFDAAVSLLVFNFIPDSGKALLELRRVTRPGGEISAAVWDYGSGMRMLRSFWDAAIKLDPEAQKLDEKHMPLCRSGELSALWTQAGLKTVRERPIDIEMNFTSFADFWDPFLLGQGPAGSYVQKLDPARRQTLREAIRNQVAVQRETAPFILPARVWAVRGTVPA